MSAAPGTGRTADGVSAAPTADGPRPPAHGGVFAIGDVQGCDATLAQLLERVQAREPDEIWFVGDLVNRGPDSVGSLRRIMGLGRKARCVLGNHDLHLLAAACGARAPGRRDTLEPVLQAPDRPALIEWLRHRPLAHFAHGHLMVHAGVHPAWTVGQTLTLAAEVEQVLRGAHWADFMTVMYGNGPERWRNDLSGDDRLRAIVNILTRMRYLGRDARIDVDFNDSPEKCPPELVPWFDYPERFTTQTTLVFGHWSSLGLMQRPNLIALDSGCVWGGSLTAVRLESRESIQVPCHPSQVLSPD